MPDYNGLVIAAFEKLTPNIDSIYSEYNDSSVAEIHTMQKAAVTASGAGAVAIPGMHVLGIAADVTFLLNRMSTSSYAIGASICYEENLGNILEEEDFAAVLAVWCGELDLVNLSTGKLAADLSTKVAGKTALKIIGKTICKAGGYMVGYKLGGKLAAKIGTKFGAKLGAKIGLGFIPFVGAAAGGGINWFFIDGIMEAAEAYYKKKVEIAKAVTES